MPLPTLLQAGFLTPPKWMSKTEAEKLKLQIPIEFIINFLSDRVPEKKGTKPKKQPKQPGDKVIVLKSSTGSGKSTTLPSALYTHFIERTRKNIAVTQPRILTCVDIPQGIVEFAKDLELDKNIGYNTGTFKRVPSEKGVIFCTTEIIAQQILAAETPEEFMDKYQFIIIDEVHTRDLAIDRLLFLLKKLMIDYYEDPNCPILILTSATFDETIFIDYFDVPRENYIEVEGFAYPKTEFYPEYDINDYQQYAIKKSMQIHIENIKDVVGDEVSMYRDIMIFVPTTTIGEKMMLEFLQYNCTVLSKQWSDVLKWKENTLDKDIESLYRTDIVDGGKTQEHAHYYVLPILLTKATFEAGGLEYQNMFSDVSTISLPIWKLKDGEHLDITKKPDKFVVPSRRIIIGTNIAETGITIDSLKYCVDTGYEFHVEFNPDFGANLVLPKECTQGMVIQRKGRVGRKSPGFWYPCFTKETFETMQKDQYANVIMAEPIDNLLNIIINEVGTKLIEEAKPNKQGEYFQRNYLTNNSWWKLESKKTISIGAMDFLEMPSASSLQYSIEKLHVIGMLDDDYSVTLFGYLANFIKFISVESKRMIFGGFAVGASIMDLVTMAAFIYTTKRTIFSKKFKMPNVLGKSNFDFIYRVLIGDELIGCVLLWNVYNEWVASKIHKLFKSEPKYWKNINGMISTEAIKSWCDNMGIVYEGWIKLIQNRDSLIENLLTIGVNIYYNGLDIPYNKYNLKEMLRTNLEEGLEEVKKFKKAIYQSHFLNLCQWNENKKTYMLVAKNIPLQIKSEVLPYLNPVLAKQTKPQYIVVSGYTLGQSSTSATFEFSCSEFVSVMDNYVNVDLKLGLN